MSTFLVRGIEKLLKECGKRFPELRDDSQKCLGDLKNFSSYSKEKTKDCLNGLLKTFRVGCQTKVPKIVEASLDCLQKLIGSDLLSPKTLSPENYKELLQQYIQIVCECFDYEKTHKIPEDEVQLQIIKALLTAVSAPNCDIHGTTLLIVVRTCYNIYLLSQNPVNQTTAKATLTQMLSLLFQRLEKSETTLMVSQSESIDESNKEVKDTSSLDDQQEKKTENENQSQEKQTHTGQFSSTQENQSEEKPANKTPTNETTNENSSQTHINSEVSQEVQEAAAVAAAAASSSSPSPSLSSNIFDDIFKGLKDQDLPTSSEPMNEMESSSSNDELYNDCYQIFRILCRLSLKDAQSENSVDLRSKVLSLELIHGILESSSHILTKNQKFIQEGIKKHLCVSLLVNGVSFLTNVFKVTLNIMLTLIEHYKHTLKNEIDIFFTQVLLHLLENPKVSIHQKHIILRVLVNICKNPQGLVDLFLNYDCDIESHIPKNGERIIRTF